MVSKKQVLAEKLYQERIAGLVDAGWVIPRRNKWGKSPAHWCPRIMHDTDIANLPVSYRDMSLKTRMLPRSYHRGLYIHEHLDDPTIRDTAWKDLPLPKWWWIISNKESD